MELKGKAPEKLMSKFKEAIPQWLEAWLSYNIHLQVRTIERFINKHLLPNLWKQVFKANH